MERSNEAPTGISRLTSGLSYNYMYTIWFKRNTFVQCIGQCLVNSVQTSIELDINKTDGFHLWYYISDLAKAARNMSRDF